MKERVRINMNVIHNGPVLNQDQQNMLDLNFTPDEIKDAIWSIPEDKRQNWMVSIVDLIRLLSKVL